IASIVAFPMAVQAQSLYEQHLQERDFQERTSPQDSNYVRLVSSGMQDRLPSSSYQNQHQQHQQEYSQDYSREYTFAPSPSVTESGTRPAVVPSGGWARDMPLALAVRQVVPANFSLNENGVSLSSNVSWSGDLPWPLALQDISRQGRFVSHIDWDKKEVSLAPVMAKPSRRQSNLAISSILSSPRSSYATTDHD